jgi:hypothetical protein
MTPPVANASASSLIVHSSAALPHDADNAARRDQTVVTVSRDTDWRQSVADMRRTDDSVTVASRRPFTASIGATNGPARGRPCVRTVSSVAGCDPGYSDVVGGGIGGMVPWCPLRGMWVC